MRALQILLLLSLLSACGYKGPLYLPDDCRSTCTQPATATKTTTQP